jgi:PPM family protein phosphatase
MRSFWNIFKKHKTNYRVPDNKTELEVSHDECKRTLFAPVPHLCAITDTGRVRDHNEDAYCVSPDYFWFAVADGMGGHEAGEVAAALAIQALMEYMTPERLAAAAAGARVGALLLDAVTAAHNLVLEANQGRNDGKEMGCTLAIGSIVDGLVTCHAGDVRCYIMREGVLNQITHDHSVVGSLVEAGDITPEQARIHPLKNQVTQAVGMSMGVMPEVTTAPLLPNDRILICSDGLWESMPHEELQAILRGDGPMDQQASQLVNSAIEAGGRDNITAILYQVVPA